MRQFVIAERGYRKLHDIRRHRAIAYIVEHNLYHFSLRKPGRGSLLPQGFRFSGLGKCSPEPRTSAVHALYSDRSLVRSCKL